MSRKKRRKRTTNREGQTETKRIFLQLGDLQEIRKKGSNSISIYKGFVGSLITILLMALVINLLSRFSWHGATYESNHFLKQWRRIVMTKTPTSIGNKTTKVKKLREDGFCVFLFLFCLGFVLLWVFLLCFCQA